MKLAQAYSWGAERVTDPDEVQGALERMLAAEGPYLVDLSISRDQAVFPMVAPGGELGDELAAGDCRADEWERAKIESDGAAIAGLFDDDGDGDEL